MVHLDLSNSQSLLYYKHNYDNTTDIMNKQFINADTQSSNKCAEISEINKFLFMDIQITTIKLLGKHVIKTNSSKFDARFFSEIRL